jgi:hypothetical protein
VRPRFAAGRSNRPKAAMLFSHSATAGTSAPYTIPQTNATEFFFSDPYRVGSTLLDQSKPGLPNGVPLEKVVYIDASTGACSDLDRSGPALSDGCHAEGRLRRREVEHLAHRYAHGLRYRCGLLPTPYVAGTAPIVSPVVLLHLPNCLQFPPLLFGVWASGLTA